MRAGAGEPVRGRRAGDNPDAVLPAVERRLRERQIQLPVSKESNDDPREPIDDFIAGCATLPVGAADAQAADDQRRADYSLTISTGRTEFHPGEQVNVRVTLKNISERPLLAAKLTPPGAADLHYKTYVYDESGSLASETKYGKMLRTDKGENGKETVIVENGGMLRYLKAGESAEEDMTLNKLFDLSKPGKYTVQVQGRGDTEGLAKSNVITIVIK